MQNRRQRAVVKKKHWVIQFSKCISEAYHERIVGAPPDVCGGGFLIFSLRHEKCEKVGIK
jgi:hypothetical protein